MKPVFKCDYCCFIGTKEAVEEHEKVCIDNPAVKCCCNCKYAYENPYAISSGFYKPTPTCVCIYRPCTNDNSNVLYTGDPIPEENICEHYERGTPRRIIPL